jgi:WD40 repeat protein
LHIGNEAVIGCASGEIYRFKDCECIAIIQAHGTKEPVLCMYFNPVTGNLITGSKDANIKTWDANLKEVGVPLDLSEDVDGDGIADSGSLNPSVLTVHQIGDTILIGTNGCDIYEATLPSTPTMHHTLDRIARSGSCGVWRCTRRATSS